MARDYGMPNATKVHSNSTHNYDDDAAALHDDDNDDDGFGV